MSKWEMVRLGDVATVVSGSTPRTSVEEYWDGEFCWVTPAEIKDTDVVISYTARKITAQAIADTGLKPIPEGTILLSSRAPIGKVAIAGVEMYCNQGFKNLICSDKIYNKYLFWFLKGKTDFLNSLGRGATFKEISKGIVEEIEVALPPLETQRKIAKILDTVSEILAMRKQQLAELDNLIKSTFYDMFGDPVANEKGWPQQPIGEFSTVRIGPFGSLLHKEDYIRGGRPLINPSHIIDGGIVPDSELTVTDAKFLELRTYQMREGDIVVGRRGEIGRCAVVDSDGYLCGTGSMFIRINQPYLPKVLQFIISSQSIRLQLEHKSVGVTMKNLNASTIASLIAPSIPLSLQQEFLELTYRIDAQKAQIIDSIGQTQYLFDSLMSHYFD